MEISALHTVIKPLEHRALLDFWVTARANRPMPRRIDIRPDKIGTSVLPHVGLIDVLEGGERFRYRLVGTAMNNLYGRDYTGQMVDQAKSKRFGGALTEAYRHCAMTASVCYFEALNRFATGHVRRAYRLLTPLSEDAQSVNMILFSTIADSVRHLPLHVQDALIGDAITAIEPGYEIHGVPVVRQISSPDH